MKTAAKILLAFSLCLPLAAAQTSSPSADVQRLLANPTFNVARMFIENDHERMIADTIQLTEIEAPPFKEARRGKAFLEMLRQAGLSDVTVDSAGNVIGVRKGLGRGPIVAIAAHLDTVFPEGTNVKVHREGTKLRAPGVADNAHSLAVMLSIVRALESAKVQTASDILFVGNVGEEGPGDLRGMKYLFQQGPYRGRIKMFISLDNAGVGNTIVINAVGSKRYRVTFKGPGGHSFGAFGIVNPAFALGNAIEKFSKMPLPTSRTTTFNVGVIGGGTSVNSIPFESWMEIDLRSESKEQLNTLAATVVQLMKEAADEENLARSIAQGAVSVDVQLIGDRPSGQISVNAPIVQTSTAVIRAFGMNPTYSTGSTDSNIPISMGIPAITIDCGGLGGRVHALDEWLDLSKSTSVRGIHIAMGTLLVLAAIQ
jgi:tripeptide aminopeptidase